YQAIAHCKKHKEKLINLIKDRRALENLGLKSAEQIHLLYQKLSEWKRKAHFQNFAGLFEEIVRESGFLSHILSLPSASDKLDKLNSLFDEVKSLLASHKEYFLPQFIAYVKLLKDHNLLIKKGLKQKQGKVRLMTAHKAKGMEFDIVYIANAYDSHWGNRRKREKISLPGKVFSLLGKAGENDHEDERNLFYVAITRARKEVFISYAKKSATKSLPASGGEQLPSQYIAEIEASLIKELDTSKIEASFSKEKEILFAAPQNSGQPISKNEKEFLNQLFLDRGLSVTALNNYLACPWQYFFKNLVRLPQAKTKHMSYGTAIHEALHKALEKVKEGEMPGKEFLLSAFEKELEKEPLSKAEFEELLEKGRQALSIYFDSKSKSWSANTLNEFNVKHVPLKTEDGKEFFLNGKIDKIEQDPASGECNVVDYKTGKPKSANVLQGKTKNSTGDYHRQLVFYKILLDRYQVESPATLSGASSRIFNMKTGEIDFVEPSDTGKHISHKFEIRQDQAKELESQVKNIAKEILNLSFWDKNCEEKDCQYCKLSLSLK
ncbi:MAG: PD-(D/E)XK nuclease family protein, partial [bacterium]|nr:PD-(D/E)XK nuclease family protein [bacterium]